MGSIEALASDAGVPIHRLGALRLVRSDDALALLEEADRQRVRVLGAEGFRVEGAQVTPDIEAILDLSGLDDQEQSVADARAFVREVADADLLLEFIVGDKSTAS